MASITPLLIIIAKSVTVYLCIILLFRLLGKKELAQLSVIDLVFILLISNSVQNAMVGNDTSLQGGLAAAVGLFACNYVFKYFLRKSAKLDTLLEGNKILLVHDGRLEPDGLKKAMMTIDELERAVREHGVEKIEMVNLAVLEVDGNVSILSDNYTRKTQKQRKKPQISHNP
jgi:uncharacterized membrane protein YcaP (DUF421 family)